MATIAVFRSSMMKPSLCRFASTVNSAIFQKYGNPANVLRMQKTRLPEVSNKDVQIRMLASPVTSFDVDTIYGRNPLGFCFPAVAGSEGVGLVEKVGEGVTSVNPKDTVMLIKPFQGTWSEQVVVSEDKVLPAPQGVDLEIVSALMNSAGIAYRLLADFAELKPGDFVLQNDASSPVGMAVIQLCKKRGIKTINIVKDVGEYSEMFRRLESIGGEVIVRESQVSGTDFKKIMADLPAPKLALNGRGGETMTNTCRLMKNATVVTYNESSYEPFQLAASHLLSNNLCLKGFNMNAWLESATKSEVSKMVEELAAMVRADDLRLFLKKDKFSQVADAVDAASSPAADRTPVMLMDQ